MASNKTLMPAGTKTMVASLLFAAALMPAVIMGVLYPEGLRLTPRADEEKTVRIWIEPAKVVTEPGVELKLEVYAAYDNRELMIPRLTAGVVSDSGVNLGVDKIEYRQPFKGTVKLGTITARTEQPGQFEVEVNPESVYTTLPDINVNTAAATIISQK